MSSKQHVSSAVRHSVSVQHLVFVINLIFFGKAPPLFIQKYICSGLILLILRVLRANVLVKKMQFRIHTRDVVGTRCDLKVNDPNRSVWISSKWLNSLLIKDGQWVSLRLEACSSDEDKRKVLIPSDSAPPAYSFPCKVYESKNHADDGRNDDPSITMTHTGLHNLARDVGLSPCDLFYANNNYSTNIKCRMTALTSSGNGDNALIKKAAFSPEKAKTVKLVGIKKVAKLGVEEDGKEGSGRNLVDMMLKDWFHDPKYFSVGDVLTCSASTEEGGGEIPEFLVKEINGDQNSAKLFCVSSSWTSLVLAGMFKISWIFLTTNFECM